MSDESVGEGFPHDVDETEATGRGLASADGLTSDCSSGLQNKVLIL